MGKLFDFYFENNKEILIDTFISCFNLTEEEMQTFKKTVRNKNQSSKLYKYLKKIKKDKYDDSYQIVLAHLTTVDEEIIKKTGIKSLRTLIEDDSSEIYKILAKNNVFINVKKRCVPYDNNMYSLNNASMWKLEEAIIGERACANGFIYTRNITNYNPSICAAPEIINKIDSVFRTCIANDWKRTHKELNVVFFKTSLSNLMEGYRSESFVEIICKIIFNLMFKDDKSGSFEEAGLYDDIDPKNIIKIEKASNSICAKHNY